VTKVTGILLKEIYTILTGGGRPKKQNDSRKNEAFICDLKITIFCFFEKRNSSKETYKSSSSKG
jgi:hypothetical protein